MVVLLPEKYYITHMVKVYIASNPLVDIIQCYLISYWFLWERNRANVVEFLGASNRNWCFYNLKLALHKFLKSHDGRRKTTKTAYRYICSLLLKKTSLNSNSMKFALFQVSALLRDFLKLEIAEGYSFGYVSCGKRTV